MLVLKNNTFFAVDRVVISNHFIGYRGDEVVAESTPFISSRKIGSRMVEYTTQSGAKYIIDSKDSDVEYITTLDDVKQSIHNIANGRRS